jgi:hypothetical protein
MQMKVRAAGGVGVLVHVPAAADMAPDHHTAQQHQECGHEQLRGRPQGLGELDAQGDHEQGHSANRNCMPQAPEQTQSGRRPHPLGAGSRGERRDGRKMVWLKGMAEAQQATDGENGYN